MRSRNRGIGIVLFVVLLIASLCAWPVMGIFPFGPERHELVVIKRLYIDYSGGSDSASSAYMVGTDKGVFEVDNSLYLGIFNADEIYAQMQEGMTCTVRVVGHKYVNFFLQQYPGITSVRPAE